MIMNCGESRWDPRQGCNGPTALAPDPAQAPDQQPAKNCRSRFPSPKPRPEKLCLLMCFPGGNVALHKVWARASLIIAFPTAEKPKAAAAKRPALLPDPWTSLLSRAPLARPPRRRQPPAELAPARPPRDSHGQLPGRQSDKTCLGYAPGSKMVIADTLKNCPTAVPMSVLLPLYGTTMTFASMQ